MSQADVNSNSIFDQQRLSAGGAIVRNPLSVIALFVLLTEAIATTALVQVHESPIVATPLTWFVVIYPFLIAAAFFLTIWIRHENLYAPMDFRSDESFHKVNKRLDLVEIRQQATQLDHSSAVQSEWKDVIDRLLKVNDVRSAVRVGRTFLENRQYFAAEEVFRYVLECIPKDHERYYHPLSNLGYAQIGYGNYDEGIESLNASIALRKSPPRKWHLYALAYAHFQRANGEDDQDLEKFRVYISQANEKVRRSEVGFYQSLYPEIKDQIACQN